MSLIKTFLHKIKKPPVLSTPWGPVTEAARKQAALNLRDDPEKFKQVWKLIEQQTGLGPLDALKEMKRRYPESFE